MNRRLTTSLTLLSISFSVALLLGVERIRLGAKDSFTNTISQTDLIVGARGGPIQLLLYSVFRMGNATNNVSYESYQKLRSHPAVAWTIPYSMGDSHRGYRVVGTTEDFYRHYRFRGDRKVELKEGQQTREIFDVVLGYDVAERLDYKIGQNIVLAHGVTEVAFQKHDDRPFKIVGVLDKTATPIDQSVYITLAGMEALHIDWTDGAPPRAGEETPASEIRAEDLQIDQVTAILVRTKTRMETLQLQREINEFEEEALMAIIPGVALSDLWQGLSYAENGLRIVSAFVVAVGMLGMLISIYNSLNERRREMAILRSIGAGPRVVFSLLVSEAVFLSCLGTFCGIALMYLLFLGFQPIIEYEFGLNIPVRMMTQLEWICVGAIVGFGFLLGLFPAWHAYRNALADGLTIRV